MTRLPLATSILLIGALLPAQTKLTAEQVTAFVQAAGEKFGTKGISLAVVQDGELLVEVAVGERTTGQPMTPTTLTNIASCSKAFTAAAVALLVEEKKLGWDDLVVTHLPEFRMNDPWITAHMTIRDLLSHRSGMTTFEGDLLWYGSDYDDAEVLRRLARLPIPQRFREQFGYQNLMYMVAGMVVHRVSGQRWEDFVEQRFFAPLGMTASRAAAQRLPAAAEKAIPHIDGIAVQDHEFVAGKPAAAIYSSVHELVHWMRMLLDDGRWQGKRVLGKATLDELWRPNTIMGGRGGVGTGASTEDFHSYAMGWFLTVVQGKKLVEHDGGMPGFLSKVSLVPEDRFGFVVLNNGNDGVVNEALKRAILTTRAGGDGMQDIERIATVKKRIDAADRKERERREAQRVADTKPSAAVERYVGHYEDSIYGPAKVELVDGKLHLVLIPSQRRLFGDMVHWHRDTFRVDFPDRFLPFALVTFDFGADGKVAGFKIDCPIADFDFGALDFRRQPAPAK
ncbi:MAG: serine hydrolase [Planctomycetes bacterium]|nr:serine hydrolase [Planctomycetota bacterium]